MPTSKRTQRRFADRRLAFEVVERRYLLTIVSIDVSALSVSQSSIASAINDARLARSTVEVGLESPSEYESVVVESGDFESPLSRQTETFSAPSLAIEAARQSRQNVVDDFVVDRYDELAVEPDVRSELLLPVVGVARETRSTTEVAPSQTISGAGVQLFLPVLTIDPMLQELEGFDVSGFVREQLVKLAEQQPQQTIDVAAADSPNATVELVDIDRIEAPDATVNSWDASASPYQFFLSNSAYGSSTRSNYQVLVGESGQVGNDSSQLFLNGVAKQSLTPAATESFDSISELPTQVTPGLDSITPEIVPPNIISPEIVTPSVVPSTVVPSVVPEVVVVPDLVLPEIVTPVETVQSIVPSTITPKSIVPELTVPELAAPDVTVSDATVPVPRVTPNVDAPSASRTPEISLPIIVVPEVDASEVITPAAPVVTTDLLKPDVPSQDFAALSDAMSGRHLDPAFVDSFTVADGFGPSLANHQADNPGSVAPGFVAPSFVTPSEQFEVPRIVAPEVPVESLDSTTTQPPESTSTLTVEPDAWTSASPVPIEEMTGWFWLGMPRESEPSVPNPGLVLSEPALTIEFNVDPIQPKTNQLGRSQIDPIGGLGADPAKNDIVVQDPSVTSVRVKTPTVPQEVLQSVTAFLDDAKETTDWLFDQESADSNFEIHVEADVENGFMDEHIDLGESDRSYRIPVQIEDSEFVDIGQLTGESSAAESFAVLGRRAIQSDSYVGNAPSQQTAEAYEVGTYASIRPFEIGVSHAMPSKSIQPQTGPRDLNNGTGPGMGAGNPNIDPDSESLHGEDGLKFTSEANDITWLQRRGDNSFAVAGPVGQLAKSLQWVRGIDGNVHANTDLASMDGAADEMTKGSEPTIGDSALASMLDFESGYDEALVAVIGVAIYFTQDLSDRSLARSKTRNMMRNRGERDD